MVIMQGCSLWSGCESEVPALARRMIAVSLAASLADPRSPRGAALSWVQEPDLLNEAWQVIVESTPTAQASELGIGEVAPERASAAGLVQWLRLDRSRRETLHQRVFGLVVSRECPPYETEYSHWKDPTYRATQLADVAGFYRAFGLEPDRGFPERHDHIALELEFVAYLLQKSVHAGSAMQQREIVEQAAKSFLAEHLVWWAPTFARCLERRVGRLISESDVADAADLGILTDVALLLRAWITAQRLACGVEPCRRLTSPEVDTAPPEAAAECGQCGTGSAMPM